MIRTVIIMALSVSIWVTASPAAEAQLSPALSDADVKRYNAIFTAQERGAWKAADRQIQALDNKVLMGYVLEQRYMHPTAYRSSYRELSRWLNSYADHPQAFGIHKLARTRQTGNVPPQRPTGKTWRREHQTPLPPALAADYETSTRRSQVTRIERRLRELTRKGNADQALRYLNHPSQFNALTAAQTDRARGWIAASYYYKGELTKADRLARRALRRSTDSAILSYWVAGLVAFRRDNMGDAADFFAAQANIPEQEPTLRAAAAYWASRASTAQGDLDRSLTYLYVAADHPLTFYGQLALEQLGLDAGVNWTTPVVTDENLLRVAARSPRVMRAHALAQLGRVAEAEVELKWAQGEVSPQDDGTLIALAAHHRLANAQLILAHYADVQNAPYSGLAVGAFPLPGYAPHNGFEIDRAVLFGLIRQESKFDPTATSKAGARGLMQLMPRTASYVSGSSRASRRLFEPGYNMQLGQTYVDQLLTRYNDGSGNLFEMALSYNWGPGNFQRWQARTPIDDQLLMLESVPNAEARHFVETVLTNIWVYRDRLGEPAPSRAAVAAGRPPVYQSVSANSTQASD